jgi:hypothetical protein
MLPAVSLRCYAAGRGSGEARGVAAQKVTLIRLSICHPEQSEEPVLSLPKESTRSDAALLRFCKALHCGYPLQ